MKEKYGKERKAMSRTLTEQKVLKKLGIPDFRHMTKDKIIQFATCLPKMDPEVAKKALEQFPEFAKSATEIVSYYKDVVEKSFDENNTSLFSFYASCDAIIDCLREQLKDGELSFEEKNIIIDKMIELAKMKADKDTENKKFIADIVGKVGLSIGAALLAVGAVLGTQTSIGVGTSNEIDDEEDLDVVDYQ